MISKKVPFQSIRIDSILFGKLFKYCITSKHKSRRRNEDIRKHLQIEWNRAQGSFHIRNKSRVREIKCYHDHKSQYKKESIGPRILSSKECMIWEGLWKISTSPIQSDEDSRTFDFPGDVSSNNHPDCRELPINRQDLASSSTPSS